MGRRIIAGYLGQQRPPVRGQCLVQVCRVQGWSLFLPQDGRCPGGMLVARKPGKRLQCGCNEKEGDHRVPSVTECRNEGRLNGCTTHQRNGQREVERPVQPHYWDPESLCIPASLLVGGVPYHVLMASTSALEVEYNTSTASGFLLSLYSASPITPNVDHSSSQARTVGLLRNPSRG